MDALSDRRAPERWSSAGTAADTSLVENGASNAGRPDASVQGVLQPGEVLRTSGGSFTIFDRFLNPA